MKKYFKTLLLIFLCLHALGCQEQKRKIPEGFHIVEEQGDEFVIVDEKGNEFIWVPVEKLSRYDFDQQKEVEKNQPINRIFYGEERKESITYHSEKNFSNFEKSVLKYKGFYISRYLISERDSLLSKENQKSITYVTRDEALELANGYLNTNSTVSSLPSSYAYDTIFRLLDEGKLQYYEDVGKLSEWSTEYSSNAYYDYKEECVSRGTNVSDRKRDVSLRKQNSSDAANEFTGFRIVLYFK